MKEYLIEQTSDGSGDSVDTSESPVFGRLYAVFVEDGDLVDNFDITLTYENSRGVSVTVFVKANMSADGMFYPRELVHKTEDGAALTGTSGGDRDPPVVAGVVTSTLADGGDTKTGSVTLYVI